MKQTREMFGQRVAELRKRKDMTQAEVAQQMSARMEKEVAPLTVTRIESGSRPTSVDELIALSEVLDQPPEALLPKSTLWTQLRWSTEALTIALERADWLGEQIKQHREEAQLLGEISKALATLQRYQDGGTAAGVEQALLALARAAEQQRNLDHDLNLEGILRELMTTFTDEMKTAVGKREDDLEEGTESELTTFALAVGQIIEEYNDDPTT